MITRIVLFPPVLDALTSAPGLYEVTIRLVEPAGDGQWRAVIGFLEDVAIHGPARFTVRGERVEVALAPNARIRPAGTAWEITLEAEGAGRRAVVELKDAAGPVHLADLLEL